jgi:hypothetical protein
MSRRKQLSLNGSGVFISNGDTSLVLATNGAIASEFKDLDHSGWLLTGFMLAMCATQPLVSKAECHAYSWTWLF